MLKWFTPRCNWLSRFCSWLIFGTWLKIRCMWIYKLPSVRWCASNQLSWRKCVSIGRFCHHLRSWRFNSDSKRILYKKSFIRTSIIKFSIHREGQLTCLTIVIWETVQSTLSVISSCLTLIIFWVSNHSVLYTLFISNVFSSLGSKIGLQNLARVLHSKDVFMIVRTYFIQCISIFYWQNLWILLNLRIDVLINFFSLKSGLGIKCTQATVNDNLIQFV